MPPDNDWTGAITLGDVDGDLVFGNGREQNRLYLNDGTGIGMAMDMTRSMYSSIGLLGPTVQRSPNRTAALSTVDTVTLSTTVPMRHNKSRSRTAATTASPLYVSPE